MHDADWWYMCAFGFHLDHQVPSCAVTLCTLTSDHRTMMLVSTLVRTVWLAGILYPLAYRCTTAVVSVCTWVPIVRTGCLLLMHDGEIISI